MGEVIGVRLGYESRIFGKELMHLFKKEKKDETWDLLPLCIHQRRPREEDMGGRGTSLHQAGSLTLDFRPPELRDMILI